MARALEFCHSQAPHVLLDSKIRDEAGCSEDEDAILWSKTAEAAHADPQPGSEEQTCDNSAYIPRDLVSLSAPQVFVNSPLSGDHDLPLDQDLPPS